VGLLYPRSRSCGPWFVVPQVEGCADPPPPPLLLLQRAALKFAHYTGAKTLSGRHTPGTFTNQQQKNFEQPRLLVVTDPRTDHQVSRVAIHPPPLLPEAPALPLGHACARS